MYSARLQECKSPRISLNKQRKCETSRTSEPMFHTPLQRSRFNPHLALGTALSILLAAKTTCHDLRIDGPSRFICSGAHVVILSSGKMAGKPLRMEGGKNVLKGNCLQESCIEKPYFTGNDFWKCPFF